MNAIDEGAGKTERILPLVERTPWQRPRNEWLVRAGVLVLLAALFLPNLGAFGLWDPWETHYGEVSRNMVESYDWISPWWGYRNKIGDQGAQGSYFYSKPILIFWMEAASVRLIGFSEWAIRLPVALYAILLGFFAYYVLSKVWTRRAGFLGALIAATSPQYFMLARQAQTDMLFVAPLTVGILFLLLALFGPDEGAVSRRNFIAKQVFGLGVFLIATIPQCMILATDLSLDRKYDNLPPLQRALAELRDEGVLHAAGYGVLIVAYLAWYLTPLVRAWLKKRPLSAEMRDTWIRRSYVLVFVTMCGVATLGKGLLGFMLPGAILLVYVLVTKQWAVLKALEIPRAILAFIPVTFPWYVAMFVKHGNGFYSRFFIHDHFNRLGTGVHQIDSGTFEHFLKWLGIGMYPWVAFVPLALLVLSRVRLAVKTRENQTALFVFIWFLFAYVLFTIAKTKFHHYIFPALPPMAYLIGKSLSDLAKAKGVLVKAGVLLAAGLFVAVTYNLSKEQQMFRDLVTYKYDRALPKHLPIDVDAQTSDDKPEVCTADTDCGPLKHCTEDGTCSNTWATSQFYSYSTDMVKWALNQDIFLYDNMLIFWGVLGLGSLLFMFFPLVRRAGMVGLVLLGITQTAWAMSYYIPQLSPHWSQKSVFEDYYALCGDKLKNVEQDAYDPLIKKIGLDGLYDYFHATSKRVCPYNITSWLIVWRGETYYSYNELLPLEKKNVQLEPYLASINPATMELPADCPMTRQVCPRKFFVFMENRDANSASSVASSVNSEMNKIKKNSGSPGYAAYSEVDKWEARKVNRENDYFTLFQVDPVYKKGAAHCSCANAEMP